MKLSERMRKYEKTTDYIISSRVPIVGRIDGQRFSKNIKKWKLNRPYDVNLKDAMVLTALTLAEKMIGTILIYTQSDEISFIMMNDKSVNDEPWFGNRIQKIASSAASLATREFCCNFKPATFDCRVWYLPNYSEVYNYLIERQIDCMRNSILISGYYEISKIEGYGKKTAQKILHGLGVKKIRKKMLEIADVNWLQYPEWFKNGIIITKETCKVKTDMGDTVRSKWVSSDAPIFTGEKANWIKELVNGGYKNGQDENKRNKADE